MGREREGGIFGQEEKTVAVGGSSSSIQVWAMLDTHQAHLGGLAQVFLWLFCPLGQQLLRDEG